MYLFRPQRNLWTCCWEHRGARPSRKIQSGMSIVLRECRPSKEVPKLRPGKVPKRRLRKVVAPNRVLRKVPKKCSGVPSPVLFSTEARTPKHMFGTFLGTPRLGPTLSKALLSALFLVGALALLWMVGTLVTIVRKMLVTAAPSTSENDFDTNGKHSGGACCDTSDGIGQYSGSRGRESTTSCGGWDFQHSSG